MNHNNTMYFQISNSVKWTARLLCLYGFMVCVLGDPVDFPCGREQCNRETQYCDQVMHVCARCDTLCAGTRLQDKACRNLCPGTVLLYSHSNKPGSLL